MNIKEPIVNPSLVDAIRKMREDQNQDTINAMVNEVMASHFLAPVEMELNEMADAEGTHTLKKDTTMQFHTLQTQGGERYLMAFTDWEELRKWKSGENIKTVVMQFDDYAAMILKDGSSLKGFVINPFGENIPFEIPLIQSLKEQKELKEKGHSEHVVKKGESIRIGQPKDYPHELVNALKKYMKKEKRIHVAYLQLMMKDEEESWLVALDFDGERNDVFGGIAEAAKPYLKGKFIDLIAVDGLGAHVLDEVEPFYKELFYKRSHSDEESIACIEETFAMKEKGCVLGCHIQQGSFSVKDEVDVLNGNGELQFRCIIDGIENKSGRVQKVVYGKDDSKAGMLVLSKVKSDFEPGYQLKKRC